MSSFRLRVLPHSPTPSDALFKAGQFFVVQTKPAITEHPGEAPQSERRVSFPLGHCNPGVPAGRAATRLASSGRTRPCHSPRLVSAVPCSVPLPFSATRAQSTRGPEASGAEQPLDRRAPGPRTMTCSLQFRAHQTQQTRQTTSSGEAAVFPESKGGAVTS